MCLYILKKMDVVFVDGVGVRSPTFFVKNKQHKYLFLCSHKQHDQYFLVCIMTAPLLDVDSTSPSGCPPCNHIEVLVLDGDHFWPGQDITIQPMFSGYIRHY